MSSGLNTKNARNSLKNYNNRGYPLPSAPPSPGYNNRGYPLASAPGAYLVPIGPNNSAVYKPSGLNTQKARSTLQRITNSIFPSQLFSDPKEPNSSPVENNSEDPIKLNGGYRRSKNSRKTRKQRESRKSRKVRR